MGQLPDRKVDEVPVQVVHIQVHPLRSYEVQLQLSEELPPGGVEVVLLVEGDELLDSQLSHDQRAQDQYFDIWLLEGHSRAAEVVPYPEHQFIFLALVDLEVQNLFLSAAFLHLHLHLLDHHHRIPLHITEYDVLVLVEEDTPCQIVFGSKFVSSSVL